MIAVRLMLLLWGALGLAAGCAAGAGPGGPPARPPETALIAGADLSSLPHLERSGAVYRDRNGPGDALDLLADHGVNAVRLRLWHSPSPGENDLSSTVAMARRVRARGLRLLLDLHLSDTWADPGHQQKPAAWTGLSGPILEDSLLAYTRNVVRTMKAAGVLPDVIQIGNEITGGILWDVGRVGGAFDTPAQWRQLARLLAAASRGIAAALEPADSVAVMIHLDRGGDAAGAVRFLDHLAAEEADYDVIGLSYYPWWHGSPDDLRETLRMLALRYHKPLVVVETAYPWTLSWFDDTHNLVGLASQLLPGFAATPDGQRRFLREIVAAVRATPEGLGRGFYYWAPEGVTTLRAGSAWENLALFDEDGDLLESIVAFEEAAAPWKP